MCGYFSIGFIDYMLGGKTLIHYTSFSSPHDFNPIQDKGVGQSNNAIKILNAYMFMIYIIGH